MISRSRVQQKVYFSAFDGFRAFAALVVFGWHYGGLPYGWAGVDFFFVLSGFLITGILFDSRNRMHRVRNFYVRRSLRIFPLFYLVLFATFAFAVLTHDQLSRAYALWPLYLGNYAQLIFRHRDIQTIGPIMVGHFWTLAIEEQFYLLWPAVVYAVADRKKLMRICVALVVLCPLMRMAGILFFPAQSKATDILFRGTMFRCDALLIGAFCALAMRGPERGWLEKLARPMCLTFGGIFLASALANLVFWHVRESIAQQNWVLAYGLTCLDVTAAGVLLIITRERSPLAQFFAWKPLQHLGKISYGFYVYHALFLGQYGWLVLRMEHRGISHLVAHGVGAVAFFVLSYGMAFLSFKFYEEYFIRLKDKLAGDARPDDAHSGRSVTGMPAKSDEESLPERVG